MTSRLITEYAIGRAEAAFVYYSLKIGHYNFPLTNHRYSMKSARCWTVLSHRASLNTVCSVGRYAAFIILYLKNVEWSNTEEVKES